MVQHNRVQIAPSSGTILLPHRRHQESLQAGLTTVPNASGVFGANNNGGTGVSCVSSKGIGVFATGGQFAGIFDGSVQINGNVTIASGSDILFADFSEEFDVTSAADVEPGTVLVLDQSGARDQASRPTTKKLQESFLVLVTISPS